MVVFFHIKIVHPACRSIWHDVDGKGSEILVNRMSLTRTPGPVPTQPKK